MAAVPFGFSVGDFVASIELIHKAAKALRSTSGATGHYQQTLLDLELIEGVLRRVQGLSPASASQETIRTIQLCGLACHVPLDHFLQKARKLEPYLDFDRRSSAANFFHTRKAGHKLQWAILLEEDVAKLKASIGPGIEIINTLLQIESLERGAITQESLERIAEQMGRVLPVVDRITTFLQSNIATVKHIQDLPTLAHLKSELSQTATAQQMRLMASAISDLSGKLDNNATQDQANGLSALVEDAKTQQSNGTAALSTLAENSVKEMIELKKIAESSNLMLVTLMQRIPPHLTGSIIQSSGRVILDDSNQPHGFSGTNLSQPISSVLVWQGLLEALRRSVNAIFLFFFWFGPAFQLCLRTLKTMPRSPTMLLDSNITFVDALNREFSLQYQQFRYWPVVSAFLQCQFRDCPGALRITHGRFAVFKDMKATGRGVVIPSDEWEQMVRPGQRVLMSMYIGHEGYMPGHWPARYACSSCGFQYNRSLDTPGWKKW
jgi:Asp-tRNA(Asn)/Glu-tRNA(Gln) amidotransferase C subunit